MKLRSGILTAMSVAAIGIMTLQSCESEGGCGKTNISHNGSHESHNNGANCMNCHKDGGEGKGCFNLAGSVYNGQSASALSNVTVNLYSEAQGAGELRFTLKGDALGNFFTTDDVTYSGLFASVVGPSGTAHFMSSSLSSASCNTCHGVSTGRLYAD